MNETTNIPEPSHGDERVNRDKLMAGRFKFRRVDEITGTFVLVVLAVLVAAVMWTGHSQRWFKSRVTLRIDSARRRRGGNPAGIGSLLSRHARGVGIRCHVDTTGRMEAEASIRRDFFRFVRADSSAVVKMKFGVAGDSFFEITRGQGEPLSGKECFHRLQRAVSKRTGGRG